MDDPYRKDFIEAADFLFFSAVNHHSPREIIEQLLKQYPKKIIVSGMGNRGCMAGDKTGIIHQDAVEWDEAVVDTNGAGDGLAVGFLAGYVFDKFGIDDSCLRGQIAALHTCTQKANSINLIKKENLNHLFKRFGLLTLA